MTRLPNLRDIELVEASVRRTATFAEAAEVLISHPVATIAVLDDDEQVVGLFGGEELVGGLFPGYLSELRHTAFASEDAGILEERAREMETATVEKHMRRPVTVDRDTSTLHVAERFLHCDFEALAVVEGDRFLGMLPRADFCRAVLRTHGSAKTPRASS
jgi:CBS domain-containing protein